MGLQALPGISNIAVVLKKRYVAVSLILVVLAASAGVLSANALDGGAASSTTTRGTSAAPASVEELGKFLFFDNRLSGDSSISCATCHDPQQAWADGMALSAGYRGTLYFRNTPTIINAGRMPLLDWDGRFAAGDMDSLVRDHLAEAHFMNVDGRLLVERLRQVPAYEAAFREHYGSDPSYGRVLNALSAYVSSLNSVNHPYLRFLDGEADALSPGARAGLELFEGDTGCARCHGGDLLSDGEMHALGVPENPEIFSEPLRHITFRRFFRLFGVPSYVSMRSDPGLYALTFNESGRGKFRTPSLLEAARTAPYMHNGVFDTLEDVVRFYNDGGQGGNIDPMMGPLDLTDAEINSLAAFLSSLGSDEEFSGIPELSPYEPRTLGRN